MTTRSPPGSERRAGAPCLLLFVAATAIVVPGAARGGALDAEAIGKAAGTEARQGPAESCASAGRAPTSRFSSMVRASIRHPASAPGQRSRRRAETR